MPRAHPYRYTKVSVQTTIEDIYALLDKHETLHGNVAYQPPQFVRTGRGKSGRTDSTPAGLTVTFEPKGMDRRVRFRVEVEAQGQPDLVTAAIFEREVRQQMRVCSRALFYTVKVNLEAVSFGISRALVVLFPYLLLADDTTIQDKPDAHLAALLSSGALLLPAEAGPDAHGSDISKRAPAGSEAS